MLALMVGSIFGICVLLLVVWLVVELLFRFIKADTLKYDFLYLWENYPIKPEDIWITKGPGKKRR